MLLCAFSAFVISIKQSIIYYKPKFLKNLKKLITPHIHLNFVPVGLLLAGLSQTT